MAQVAQTPVNLSDVFGDTSMFPALYGARQLEQNRNIQELNQAQSLQDMMQQEQQFPLMQRQRQLANQTTEAQLPGIRATSQSLGLKADKEAATHDESIAALRAKLAKEASDEELGHLETFGQGLTQWGNIIKQNGGVPLSMQGQIPRQVLEFYKAKGADAMLQLGSTMLNSSRGVAEARIKSKDALDKAMAIEQERTKRAASIQAMRSAASAQTQRLKASGTAKPVDFEKLASDYFKQANATTEPAERAALLDAANEALQVKMQLLQATTKPGIDPAATANTGVVTPATPQPAPTVGKKPDPLGIR